MSQAAETNLVSVRQAQEILDGVRLPRRRVVDRPLSLATGMVLAESLAADRDFPAFDKSQMDGVACREPATGGTQEVVGEIAAGGWPEGIRVEAGKCVRIMTGAPMPAGADRVVPVEWIEVAPHGRSCRIRQVSAPGYAVARRASEIKAGEMALQEGVFLGAAQLAVAASVGAHHLRVYDRPRAAILTTGDELVAVSAKPVRGQIRNSNAVMLASMMEQLGCDVSDGGTVPDRPRELREAIGGALGSFDLLLISGGMSMGEHDHVPAILRELEVDLKLTKVKMKPGKPFVFGQKGACQVFGLPGNPVSAFVCVTVLASRVIRRLMGREAEPRVRSCHLAEPVGANGPRTFFQPVRMEGNQATALPWKGSSDLFTLARANGLLVREENDPARPAGSEVKVLEW